MMPVFWAAALISLAAAWLVILAPASYRAKWLLLPAIMLMWMFLLPAADSVLGYAWPHRLPAKFELISYAVVVQDGQKTDIEVWTAGERSRLYRVRYNKPMADALAAAMKKGKDGGRVTMERKDRSNGKGSGLVEADEDSYESNLVLPSDDNPKAQDN